MSKTHKLKDVDIVRNGVRLHIDTDRLERNLNNAQYALDSRVMTDMIPFMPMQTGNFIQRTAAESAAMAGTGKVVAGAAPFGRFLYYGKVMVGELSGSPWAQAGERKIVTDRNLRFAKPEARAFWFEEAKKRHKDEWTDLVRKEMYKR